ncbi:MAG: 2-amino-4-hydroxy-6-hydroxymethyldihydropteridine diphosphokinase [Bacteroidales bacterium]|nr:2-amino-4-hydroxy-6-hydroxymethyldihydropteridine diphosphokinase [Bacteroidales bacterium]
MEEIVLSFGSNLGNKKENILKAYGLLQARLGKQIKTSDIIQTEPWGFTSEELFANSVAVFQTEYSAEECLKIINQIEKELGRIRNMSAGYENRVIDIDILFYGDMIINTPDLTVPHPLLHLRQFVMIPLKQIIPEWVHPVIKKKIKDI